MNNCQLSALVLYCRVTNHHRAMASTKPLLTHSCVGQKTNTVWPGYLLRKQQGWNERCWEVWVLIWELWGEINAQVQLVYGQNPGHWDWGLMSYFLAGCQWRAPSPEGHSSVLGWGSSIINQQQCSEYPLCFRSLTSTCAPGGNCF